MHEIPVICGRTSKGPTAPETSSGHLNIFDIFENACLVPWIRNSTRHIRWSTGYLFSLFAEYYVHVNSCMTPTQEEPFVLMNGRCSNIQILTHVSTFLFNFITKRQK